MQLSEMQKFIKCKGTYDHPTNPHNIHFKTTTTASTLEVTHVFYDKNFHTYAVNVPIVAN